MHVCVEFPGTPAQECVLSPPVGPGEESLHQGSLSERKLCALGGVPRIGRKTETDRRQRDVGRDREVHGQF